MCKKNTEDLNHILNNTHAKDFEKYCEDNKHSMLTAENAFDTYVKSVIKSKGLTQQVVFLKADVPERYGYKLLSGEKRTRQRDTILRICYAAEFTIDETQQALKKYEMPQLYSKIPRDALLMILFNERPGSIIAVNEVLKSNSFEPLKTSGSQD